MGSYSFKVSVSLPIRSPGSVPLTMNSFESLCPWLAGLKFSSATAFSMHCKRLQTPNKQGDDGWKSVLYEGTPLDVFRKKYEANRHAGTPRPGEVRMALML